MTAGLSEIRCTRPVLHIGLPKTATTLFQRNLFAQHSQIAYLGKQVGRKVRVRSKQLTQTIESARQAKDPVPSNVPPIHSGISRLREQGLIPVYSCEGLSLGSGQEKQKQLEMMKSLLGPAKIVVVLRHPVKLLESLYLQCLRGHNLFKRHRSAPEWKIGSPPCYFEIDNWLAIQWEKNPIHSVTAIEYWQTIALAGRIFGHENVGVFVFEEFVSDQKKFLQSLCRFMGIDPHESLRLVSRERVHDRWSQQQVENLKRLSKSWPLSWYYRWSKQKTRKRLLNLDADSSPKAVASVSEAWKARIVDFTGPMNRKIEQEFGLPLRQYDYPV